MGAVSYSLQWLNTPFKPKHLYHYAPWFWIARSLQFRAITLSDPRTCWADPTEWLWTNWIRANIADTVLALCWTRSSRSEAFWRLDRQADPSWTNAEKTVVRIRSSFDRLDRAIEGASDLHDRLRGKSFLVPVTYLRDHQLERRFDALQRVKHVGREAAQALSFKRYPYAYEREVRWVHVTKRPGDPSGRTAVPIETNVLIDQLMIDPRASATVVETIREGARGFGFKNDLVQSKLFDLPVRLRPHAAR